MTRAAKFKDRIKIQSPVATQDDFGGTVISWVDFATVWSEVASAAGREKEIAAQLRSVQTFIITIRHLAGLDETMRVVHGTDVFDIVAIDPSVRRRGVEIKLTCIKGASDG
jgi:SPP1 family predicted phage head-tail adaptor